jgi:putative PIN family toxin of toxin-antitoxin system
VRLKAVVDTNVLISGIFWRGAPFEVLDAWQQRRFDLAISSPILHEYQRVFNEIGVKHSVPAIGHILELIALHSEMVQPVSFAKPVCADPDDDKFLEAAIAAEADYVVSGDAALLTLKHYRGIDIVKPSQFLNLLSQSSAK